MMSRLNSSQHQAWQAAIEAGPRAFRPAKGAPGLRSSAPIRIRNAFALLALGLVLLAGAAQAGSETAVAPLDLNRATAAELEALPGIGEVKAAAILAVRDARGGFASIDELESVRGIGPALAAKLRPLLKLGARPTPAGARTAKK